MKVLITSSRNKENLIRSFTEVGAELVSSLSENPKLVIPTVDEELPFFALNKKWFASLGIEVMVNDIYTINVCRDKAEFYRVCRRMGFDVLPTMKDNLIAKPRFGKGSKGIINIDSSFIVQPFCDLPEISVDYLGDREGNYVNAIARYRKSIINGESTELELANIDLTEIIRLGQEFNLKGHNVIQGFWTGSRFIFNEVNCRFGGGSWLTFNLFNSPKWLMENYCESIKGTKV